MLTLQHFFFFLNQAGTFFFFSFFFEHRICANPDLVRLEVKVGLEFVFTGIFFLNFHHVLILPLNWTSL